MWKLPIRWRYLDCEICRRRQLWDDLLLQTRAAYVILGLMHTLYRLSLLGMDKLSRGPGGESWRIARVALHVTVRRCFVEEILKSCTWTMYRIWGLQGIAVCWISARDRAAGRRLVSSIASVLLTITRSSYLVKYVCRAFVAELRLRAVVSVRHDCVNRAVPSAYSSSCVWEGRGMSEI
jgi:hypothetical protein